MMAHRRNPTSAKLSAEARQRTERNAKARQWVAARRALSLIPPNDPKAIAQWWKERGHA